MDVKMVEWFVERVVSEGVRNQLHQRENTFVAGTQYRSTFRTHVSIPVAKFYGHPSVTK